MEQLNRWLEAQFAGIKTEPNSGLGKAITYLLRHWRPLTTFLRVASAPLDNNIVERVLKTAVLHRKNALFYRTLNGAQGGDLFMSLIHTCQLCGSKSFELNSRLSPHHLKTRSARIGTEELNCGNSLRRSIQEHTASLPPLDEEEQL